MARTRRFRRRRFKPRRRYNRRSMYRLVRHAIKPERKFIDYALNDQAVGDIVADVAYFSLTQVTMGTDFNTRIGHRIRITSVCWNISIRYNAANAHYRVGMIMPFNQNYVPAPAFTANFDHDETTVLRQKRGYLHSNIPNHTYKGCVRFKGRGLQVCYDDSTSGSTRKGHLWFFHHCTIPSSCPLMLGWIRVHFVDF